MPKSKGSSHVLAQSLSELKAPDWGGVPGTRWEQDLKDARAAISTWKIDCDLEGRDGARWEDSPEDNEDMVQASSVNQQNASAELRVGPFA